MLSRSLARQRREGGRRRSSGVGSSSLTISGGHLSISQGSASKLVLGQSHEEVTPTRFADEDLDQRSPPLPVRVSDEDIEMEPAPFGSMPSMAGMPPTIAPSATLLPTASTPMLSAASTSVASTTATMPTTTIASATYSTMAPTAAAATATLAQMTPATPSLSPLSTPLIDRIAHKRKYSAGVPFLPESSSSDVPFSLSLAVRESSLSARDGSADEGRRRRRAEMATFSMPPYLMGSGVDEEKQAPSHSCDEKQETPANNSLPVFADSDMRDTKVDTRDTKVDGQSEDGGFKDSAVAPAVGLFGVGQ